MSSMLKALIEGKRIDPNLLIAAEGSDADAVLVNVLGRNADIDTSAEDVQEAGGNYAYPTVARIHAIDSSSAEDEDDSVAATEDIVVEDIAEIPAVAATGTITYGTPVNNDTVIVGGRTFTKKAAITGDDQFTTAAELTAYINSMATVNAVLDAGVITVTAAEAGADGNAITLALGGSNAGDTAVSGANLTGGEDVAIVTINGVDFVAGVDYQIGDDEEETAENLAAAINASTHDDIDGIVTAEATTDTVTLTADATGTAGNSITLATDDADAISVGAANLSGGLAPTLTGAFTVEIKGLNASYEEVTEIVTMNGTDAVNTTTAFLRINSMRVLTAGSAGTAVGAITATAATDGTVTAQIAAGATKWFGGVYTVPAGKTAFAVSMFATTPTATMIVTANMIARALGGVFETMHTVVCSSSLPLVRDRFSSAIKFAEKTDIKLRASTSANNADVTAGTELLIVKGA